MMEVRQSLTFLYNNLNYPWNLLLNWHFDEGPGVAIWDYVNAVSYDLPETRYSMNFDLELWETEKEVDDIDQEDMPFEDLYWGENIYPDYPADVFIP